MQIRKAKIADLKRVSYITKIAWKKPYNEHGVVYGFSESLDLAEQIRKRNIFILVATLDNKIIGAIRYEFLNKNQIYFSKLVTLPSYRGVGVGQALINKLESIAQKEKVKKISLDVMEEKLLVPYYKKIGYKVLRKVKFLNHHEVYMFKNLTHNNQHGA